MIARMPEPALIAAVRLLLERAGLRTSDQELVNIALPVFPSSGTTLAVDDEGVKVRLGVNATLRPIEWSIVATPSGSVTVDVLSGATAAGATSICGGSPPAISAAAELDDQDAGGFADIPDKQTTFAKITATDGVVERVDLTIRARKV